ncbi:MAG TPA: TetR/AcrR family transcriptional regulator [Actinophytocola sp.]|uniref:TetR/AcrR family transcriptional regulator n=1 Tax=Actinophytocola sp. TaxID=1872138 RepID=UPI002DF82953|nr:TetR/AcrR family transcriptional regulator [Actinophytocola sp.]
MGAGLRMVKRGYHHGDLRNALGEAAVQLASEGGPDSVTVRAAARLVGVTPTAAYRHYTGHEELVAEAKDQCLAKLGAAIAEELVALPPTGSRVQAALRNLAAAGRAYVKFALAEPGQFRTCFFQGGAVLDKDPGENAVFGMLVGLLDELVAAGFLKPDRRPMAEVAAWSAVHGLALLMLDGPLRDVSDEIKQEAIRRTMLISLSGLGDLTPELRAGLCN